MTLTDILQVGSAVVFSLGGGALLVTAFSSWIGKIWAERLLVNVEARHTIELERLKSELRTQAHERETRFSRLAEQQAEVLAAVYHRLLDLYDAGRDFLFGGFHIDAEKHKRYSAALRSFSSYLDRHEIYLGEDLLNKLRDFEKQLIDSVVLKFIGREYSTLTKNEEEEWHKKIMELWTFVTDTMPKLKDQVSRDFKNTLGVK